MMAKVTNLKGCFVRVNGDAELISSVCETLTKIKTRASYPLTDRIYITSSNDGFYLDFHSRLSNKKFKEIYFNDGEFFDEPVEVVNIDPVSMAFGIVDSIDRSDVHGSQSISDLKTVGELDLIYIEDSEKVDAELSQIPWTDGSIDEQEFTWSNGDTCLSGTGHQFTFIGMCDKNGFDCILLSDTGVPTFGFTKELSKPETEAEKKTREIAEEVNRICFDLFGTPAFDCNQDIIDTVEKFVVNGYKKVG